MLMSKNLNNDVTMNPPIVMQPNLYCPRETKENLLSITAGSCRKMGINKSLRIQPFLLVARDVSPGGTSATQRQEFHTDDVNQCLLPVVMGFQM